VRIRVFLRPREDLFIVHKALSGMCRALLARHRALLAMHMTSRMYGCGVVVCVCGGCVVCVYVLRMHECGVVACRCVCVWYVSAYCECMDAAWLCFGVSVCGVCVCIVNVL
jgi:hypothetical protein